MMEDLSVALDMWALWFKTLSQRWQLYLNIVEESVRSIDKPSTTTASWIKWANYPLPPYSKRQDGVLIHWLIAS